MSQRLGKHNDGGTGTIAFDVTVPNGTHRRLVSVSCHFGAAPTTSEDFTIDLDALAGAEYDLRLYTLDPSAGSTTDILWQPDCDLILEGDDHILVAFPGTDGAVYGVQVTLERVQNP